MDAGRSPLEAEAGAVLEQAPCDVALLVEAGGSLRAGPVVVPFGAARHDWAALELGAWVARATGAPLRLIGAASDQRTDGRDASRLLADASLIVQHRAGVVAEPLLASPGRRGSSRSPLAPACLSWASRIAGAKRAWAGFARSSPRLRRRPRCWCDDGRRRAGSRLTTPNALHVVADREPAMSVAFAPGTIFAGYRVEALVARGGMGVVFARATCRCSAGSR